MNCIHPSIINDRGSKRAVRCGRCAWCRKKLRDEWFVRFLVHSLKNTCFFTTLTYAEDYVPTRFVDCSTGETFVVRSPHDDYIFEGYDRIGSVPLLQDWQNYMKRVRKRLVLPLKYFFVSEYGSQFGRVHYHALIWCNDPGVSSVLTSEWPFGGSVVEPAQVGSLKYVTKYILKGSNHKSFDLRDDNIKSNSAGIGGDLWPKLVKFYLSPNFTNSFHYLGSIHAFPLYYKKKIRDLIDYNSDSVEIKYVRNNENKIVVKNLHCETLQKLDEQRSMPEINDNDLIHQIMRLKVKDLPSYLVELYNRDCGKQYQISNKTNLNLEL